MTSRSDITPELLRQLLDYDPETGVLTWKWRDRSWFTNGHEWSRWNTRYAGFPAFTYQSNDGYLKGSILGTSFSAHRVCWTIHYNIGPVGHIDHIDGNRSNNRLLNLQDTDRLGNARNVKLSRRNTTGTLGVRPYARTGKIKADVGVAGFNVHLGYFDTVAEAVEAREKANVIYGFHPNHGKR